MSYDFTWKLIFSPSTKIKNYVINDVQGIHLFMGIYFVSIQWQYIRREGGKADQQTETLAYHSDYTVNKNQTAACKILGPEMTNDCNCVTGIT